MGDTNPRLTGPLKRPYALAGPESPTARQAREQADEQALGGMRGAHRTVRRVARAELVGRGIQSLLHKVVGANPGVLEVARKLLRGDSVSGLPELAVAQARNHLRHGLHATALSAKHGPLQPNIIEAYNRATGDPDVHLPQWLAEGAPLGHQASIPTCGVFPQAVEESSIRHEEGDWLAYHGDWQNYQSVESRLDVGLQLLREAEASGFCRLHSSEQELKAALKGDTYALAKLGLISKMRPDGTEKHRLVWDFRRSHLNSHITQPERIVLPRLEDLVDSARELHAQRGEGGQHWLIGLDIKDAFLNIPLLEAEQPYVCTKIGPYWVQSKTLVFGASSAPLVWGRFAAWLGRSLSAILPRSFRIHTYVDDPLFQAYGSEDEVAHSLATALLWLEACGHPISWSKASGGPGLSRSVRRRPPFGALRAGTAHPRCTVPRFSSRTVCRVAGRAWRSGSGLSAVWPPVPTHRGRNTGSGCTAPPLTLG